MTALSSEVVVVVVVTTLGLSRVSTSDSVQGIKTPSLQKFFRRSNLELEFMAVRWHFFKWCTLFIDWNWTVGMDQYCLSGSGQGGIGDHTVLCYPVCQNPIQYILVGRIFQLPFQCTFLLSRRVKSPIFALAFFGSTLTIQYSSFRSLPLSSTTVMQGYGNVSATATTPVTSCSCLYIYEILDYPRSSC
jgi:hypothetical protein